jgi:hypothetical protein
MLSKKNIANLKDVNYWLNTYRTEDVRLTNLIASFAALNFGMVSFKLFIDNMVDLTEQTAIAINSFNQNEPGLTGSLTEPQEITMSGGGRNFYGQKLNDNADVPTIYSDFVKNCQTKFLL